MDAVPAAALPRALADARPLARGAWYAVGFLTLASSLSIIDRQVLALMIGPIRRDLNVTDAQMGLLGGLAYSLLYSVFMLPAAWLADRGSRRAVVSGGVLLWSLMSSACGLAHRFSTLFLARMGVGVGEAALAPAAYSMMSDLFEAETLPLAIGVFSAAPFLGVGLANIVGGSLVQHFETAPPVVLPLLGQVRSWQFTFFLVGLPGILVAAIGWLTLREPIRRGIVAGASHAPLTLRQIVAFLAERRRFLILHFTAFVALSIQGWCLFFWVVEFFVRRFGLTRGHTGLIYGLMALVLGFGGSAAAGRLASRFSAKGSSDATMRLTLISVVVLGPMAMVMPQSPQAWEAFLLLAPITFLMGWPGGLGTTALQFIVPNELKGRIIAVYLFVVNTIALTLGPWLGGMISDRMFGGRSLGGSLTVMACIDYPLAAVCIALSLRPFRAAVEKARAWDPTVPHDFTIGA